MNKDKILEIMNELYEQVQYMREEGEGDLRTVLMHISTTERKIRKVLVEQ